MAAETPDPSQLEAADSHIPKRKPVPTTASVQSPLASNSIAGSNNEQSSQTGYEASGQAGTEDNKEPVVEYTPVDHGGQIASAGRFAIPLSLAALDNLRLGPLEKYLPYDTRRRRYIVVGTIAGILAILALIIGLAAGLTAGKSKTQNLPLPTSNGGPYTGDMTYYAPALGACGITSSDSDNICAVSHIIFDAAQTGSDPNANPLCGLKIRLRRDPDQQKSVDVTVVDRCVGCKATDIDTTTSVFAQLADIDQGRVLIDWAWLENEPVNMTTS